MAFDADNWLKIVADNWADLRRCDLDRLFWACDEDNWPALYERLRSKRRDLFNDAESTVADIIKERHPDYVADQLLDPPGYALRVAVLESQGLTRGDAQGVADVEFRNDPLMRAIERRV